MEMRDDSPQNFDAGSRFKKTSCFACTLSITAGSPGNAEAEGNAASRRTLAKPFIEVLLHEVVVCQMRIGRTHAIDFSALARRQILLGIDAPAASEQALAPENLVNS